MNTRAELIERGILVPAQFYRNLERNDPRRVKYELKLIVSGIEPDCYPADQVWSDGPRSGGVVIISPVGKA